MATKTMLTILRHHSSKSHKIRYNRNILQLKRPYNIPLVQQHIPLSKGTWKNIVHPYITRLIKPRYVIHFGNLLAVCAMFQTDMLYLRGFMVGASICGIAFNLLQPIPLITPAYWGLFFIFTHSIQIYYLIRDKLSVTMSNHLNKIYQDVFLNVGFTPKQFHDLHKQTNFEVVTYQKGQHITTDRSNNYTFCLINGRAAVKTNKLGNICIIDTKNGNKNETRWFGPFLQENTDIFNYECLSDCKVIRFDTKKLDTFLNQNDNLKEKANKIMMNDILGKYKNMKESNVLNTFMGIIDVYIKCIKNKEENDDISKGIKDYLERFAKENDVDKNYIDLFLQENHGMRYDALFK